jgi:hypothetical protein
MRWEFLTTPGQRYSVAPDQSREVSGATEYLCPGVRGMDVSRGIYGVTNSICVPPSGQCTSTIFWKVGSC